MQRGEIFKFPEETRSQEAKRIYDRVIPYFDKIVKKAKIEEERRRLGLTTKIKPSLRIFMLSKRIIFAADYDLGVVVLSWHIKDYDIDHIKFILIHELAHLITPRVYRYHWIEFEDNMVKIMKLLKYSEKRIAKFLKKQDVARSRGRKSKYKRIRKEWE